MKFTFDACLVAAIALCYAAGQFVAAERFALIAGALLLFLALRLAGATLTWLLSGR